MMLSSIVCSTNPDTRELSLSQRLSFVSQVTYTYLLLVYFHAYLPGLKYQECSRTLGKYLTEAQ